MVSMGIDFLTFTQYLDDLDTQFNPTEEHVDEIIERIRDFAHNFTNKIQPPLFRAVLVLHETPLESAVNQNHRRSPRRSENMESPLSPGQLFWAAGPTQLQSQRCGTTFCGCVTSM